METKLSSQSIDGDALAFWHDVACRVFVSLACKPLNSQPFEWSIHAQALGATQVADIDVGPHTVVRRPADIAAESDDYLLMSLQLRGVGIVRQDRREAVLAPGELAVYDTTRPYQLCFPEPMAQRIVKIPRRLFSERLTVLEQLTARRIDGVAGLGAVLVRFMAATFDTPTLLRPAEARSVETALAELLTGALAAHTDGFAVDRHASPALLRERIRQYIERNLSDPGLDVNTIATAHRISPRYVHMLFNEDGVSVSRRIWGLRLERAAQMLAAPRHAQRSITEVAYACGFSDAAHFARAFRAKYAMSPRAFRASRIGAD